GEPVDALPPLSALDPGTQRPQRAAGTPAASWLLTRTSDTKADRCSTRQVQELIPLEGVVAEAAALDATAPQEFTSVRRVTTSSSVQHGPAPVTSIAGSVGERRADTGGASETMDEEAVLAALQHYIHYSAAGDEDRASEIYHEDAILEFPQSGERFDGVENFREWRRMYPAKVELEIVRLRGRDDLWVAEMRVRYDGGPWNYGPAIYEFRDEKVSRETIYVAETWEAPKWRARWRAAPPHEPGGGPAG
ncbi:MAG TPA: nuclear transport factor 2 family protein, partial [Gaiellaceae bacterium]|nr:nuclear transport factor 2 family protein [Gaiellaceae bacterium]